MKSDRLIIMIAEESENYWKQSIDLAFSHNQVKALEVIEKAIAVDPKSEKYAIEKAEILCELNRSQDAITFLSTLTPSDTMKGEIKKISEELELDKMVNKNLTEKERLEELMGWGQKNEIDISNIKVVYYSPDFRGIHALRRIRKGDRIITAKEKALVTLPKILKSCPLAKKVADCGLELDFPFPTAVACMVFEMRKSHTSWWKPYADSFPETTTTYPYFFAAEEKKYLKGTSYYDSMVAEMEDSLNEYKTICERVPELKEMGAENYLRLTTLACSRYFGIDALPGGGVAVPVIDMFNYYTDKVGEADWEYSLKEDAFMVIAKKDFARGEVIGINYGNKPSGRYLLYYGFVPENNKYMYLTINLSLDKADPLLKAKQELIAYYCDETFLISREMYFDWGVKFRENEELMSTCRFAAYEGDIKILKHYVEQIKCDKEERYKHIAIPPISLQSEIAALNLLNKHIMERIKGFPNTIDKDEEVLKTDKDLTFNARNALSVRVDEHKAYVDMLSFIDHMMKLLKGTRAEVEKEVNAMSDNVWYKEYVRKIALPLVKQ